MTNPKFLKIFIIFFFLLSGCSTAQHRVVATPDGGKKEIKVENRNENHWGTNSMIFLGIIAVNAAAYLAAKDNF